MKIKLVVSCAHYNVPNVEDEVIVPDGLSDDEVEKLVDPDLAEMRAEFVESWWEHVTPEENPQ